MSVLVSINLPRNDFWEFEIIRVTPGGLMADDDPRPREYVINYSGFSRGHHTRGRVTVLGFDGTRGAFALVREALDAIEKEQNEPTS